jgi:hypothetical protein
MILNTKSGNSGPRLVEGWKRVKVTRIQIDEAPNEKMLRKVTIFVTNDEIGETLNLGEFGVDIPIWARQNNDGSYGGEYELLNFYRSAGCDEEDAGDGKTKIDPESMKGKWLNLRFYLRPGSAYVDAHPGTSCPDNADEGMMNYKEGKFQKDLTYMRKRWAEKNPEEAAAAAQTALPLEVASPAPTVAETAAVTDDQLPF